MADNTPTGAVAMPVMRAPEYRVLYANSFRIGMSVNDASVTFMQQTDVPGLPTQVLVEQITISMTLAALKILAANLHKLVIAAEDVLGPIAIPEVSLPTDDMVEKYRANLTGTTLSTALLSEV
jgi:hypothetical protein